MGVVRDPWINFYREFDGVGLWKCAEYRVHQLSQLIRAEMSWSSAAEVDLIHTRIRGQIRTYGFDFLCDGAQVSNWKLVVLRDYPAARAVVT